MKRDKDFYKNEYSIVHLKLNENINTCDYVLQSILIKYLLVVNEKIQSFDIKRRK